VAGSFWNLTQVEGRGVAYAWEEEVWPTKEQGVPLRMLGRKVYAIMLLVALALTPFMIYAAWTAWSK